VIVIDDIRVRKQLETPKAVTMQVLCAVTFLCRMHQYPAASSRALVPLSQALTSGKAETVCAAPIGG
jgi:hypothetical protein